MLKLSKPIVFFDLETTGINVTNDRIVEAFFLKIHPDGSEESKKYIVNPTIPIPEESTKFHGLTDKDVKDAPTFKEVAKEIHTFLEGCDLAGYNLTKFDVPVISEEFLRCDIDFSLKNRKIVDAQRIFYLMEPRTLSAAYRYYCNKDLTDAHSAEADTVATYEVLKAQIEKYQGVTIKDKNEQTIEPIKNDMNALHNITASQFADLVGRIAYNDKGEEVFNFGKHKNKTVKEVFQKEPNYYDWMMRGDFALSTKKKLTEIKLSLMIK